MSEPSAASERGNGGTAAQRRAVADVRRPPSRVAIVGLGMMGGSFARALKRLPDSPYIVASTMNPAVVTRALDDGVADDATVDPRDVIADTDLVVYATPVGVTIELLAAHRALLREDATIIDLGSVKAPVLDAARTAALADRFVGCHPMCGSERSGYAAADPAMFTGATTWIVPGSESAPAEAVAALWRSIGAVPSRIDADVHDRLVAWTSHLPQILASALGGVLANTSVPRDALGPGGHDMTRLAHSPSALWTDILVRNRAMLEAPIAALRERLGAFADAITDGDAREIERLFAEARDWAERTEA